MGEERPAASPPSWDMHAGAALLDMLKDVIVAIAVGGALLIFLGLTLGGFSILFVRRKRVHAVAEVARRLLRLGLMQHSDDSDIIEYAPGYTPPELGMLELVMVPHGRTASNVALLFQSHDEGPDGRLLTSSLDDAARGAAAFLAEWGELLRDKAGTFLFLRSPLLRAEQTAEVYLRVMEAQGYPLPEVLVDPGLIEIDQGSWHGKAVADLKGEDAEAGAAYRRGNFFAAAADGECILEVLERCSSWLSDISALAAGKHVICFGHGTFQNAAETIMLLHTTQGELKTPAAIFTRRHGESHLRRAFPHIVWRAK